MYDTYVTVVGTALTTPEWRKVAKTNAVVTSFRVASNARRFDRVSEQWVDGPILRIRVNCWRRLAEGVVGSIIAGDPVVVYGRIATREWTTDQGETRLSYEIEADTVGHDLARGHARFQRRKADPAGAVVEDADSETRVNGELTELLPAGPHAEAGDLDAIAILRGVGLGPELVGGADGSANGSGESVGPTATGEDGNDGRDGEGEDGEDAAGDDTGGGTGGRGRRRGRQPVPA